MHGLDLSIDLSFLIGREVEEIRITVGQVQVHFDESVSISVESRFQHIATNGRLFDWEPMKGIEAAASIVPLLGSVVTDLRTERDGTLTLVFSAGAKLIILDNSKQYESYTISKPGETIVV